MTRPRQQPEASTTARGYGWTHQKERAKWKPYVDAGMCICPRCGQPIQPGSLWDLDHTDDRAGYLGPSHRACNRSTSGRRRRWKRRVFDDWAL
jgi:hypothetical protein